MSPHFLLLQEGYLFEVAAEVGAVGGGEEEAAEGVDAVDGGGDGAVLVEVMCWHAAAQEQREVLLFEVCAAAQGVVGVDEKNQVLSPVGADIVAESLVLPFDGGAV